MPTTIVPDCWAVTLDALHARIAPRFRCAESRTRVPRYLDALLAPIAWKNGWRLADHPGESGPQGVQGLLNVADRDTAAVRDHLIAFVVEQLGDPDGVLIVDEAGSLKDGTKSVGVQRQYGGTAGRRESGGITPRAMRRVWPGS